MSVSTLALHLSGRGVKRASLTAQQQKNNRLLNLPANDQGGGQMPEVSFVGGHNTSFLVIFAYFLKFYESLALISASFVPPLANR